MRNMPKMTAKSDQRLIKQSKQMHFVRFQAILKLVSKKYNKEIGRNIGNGQLYGKIADNTAQVRPKIYQNIATDATINKAQDLRSDWLYQQSSHRDKFHQNNLNITYLQQASESATHIAKISLRKNTNKFISAAILQPISKQQQNMTKNLYTKLTPQITNSHSHAEPVATSLLNAIVDTALNCSLSKEMQRREINLLHKESINKQNGTVEQAFARNPFKTLLSEDSNALSCVKESGRPLSAKINTFKRQVSKTRNSRRSIFRHRRSSTMNMSITIASSTSNGNGHERRKGRFERNPNEKFIMLQNENECDLEEEQYIGLLREKKLKEEAYQRQKKQFFKKMGEEQERNDKLNKKLMQNLGNKIFYYARGGELVELSQLPPKLLKKAITSKTETSRRPPNAEHQKADNVVVEYREKEGGFKRAGQAVLVSPNNHLFYRSDKCKYTILS